MRKIIFFLWVLLGVSTTLFAQSNTLPLWEYWFNDDLSTAKTETLSGNQSTINKEIVIDDYLPMGLHRLNYRVQDARDGWSATDTHYFVKVDVPAATPNALSTFEYWYNDDYSNRSALSITNGSAVVTQSLDVAAMRAGLHRFNYRVQDARGGWSATDTYYFVKVDVPAATPNALSTFEYWYNDDYSNRAAVSITNSSAMVSQALDVADLRGGLHRFNYRVQDARGGWSATDTHYFVKVDVPAAIPNVLSAFEYWYNDDYSNRQSQTIAQGQNSLSCQLTTSSLSPGIHRLNYRLQDTRGAWSGTDTYYFVNTLIKSFEGDNKIVGYRYWFNEKGDEAIEIAIDPVNPFNGKFAIDVSKLEMHQTPKSYQFKPSPHDGAHKIIFGNEQVLNLQFRDSYGRLSANHIDAFSHPYTVYVEPMALTNQDEVNKPMAEIDSLHYYSFNMLQGDSVVLNLNKSAVIDYYDSYGRKLKTVTTTEETTTSGIRASIDGGHYAIIHSFASDQYGDYKLGFTHIAKYAVLGCNVKKAANYGRNLITFSGNGFSKNVKLTYENSTNKILSDSIVVVNIASYTISLDMDEMPIGKYDARFEFPDTVIVYPNALEVEYSTVKNITVSMTGSTAFRSGSSVPIVIRVKNNNNFQVENIPFYISRNASASMKFLFDVLAPYDEGTSDSYYTISTDSVLGEPSSSVIYPLQIPYLLPNEERELVVELQSPENIQMKAWIQDPIERSLTRGFGTACIFDPCGYLEQFQCGCNVATGLMKTMSNLMVAIAYQDRLSAAHKNNIKLLREMGEDAAADALEYIPPLESPGHLLATSLGNCVKLGGGEAKANKRLVDIAKLLGIDVGEGSEKEVLDGVKDKLIDKYIDYEKQKHKGNNCILDEKQLLGENEVGENNVASFQSTLVRAFDPNDKIGYRSPSGSTYFNNKNNFTYIINLENDPEKATAAAQEVFIVDTLDLDKFDIESFKAGMIKIGDRVVQAPYDMQEHTWHIDMRPDMELRTEVTLTLDKEKGIARWVFRSIDPLTGELTTI